MVTTAVASCETTSRWPAWIADESADEMLSTVFSSPTANISPAPGTSRTVASLFFTTTDIGASQSVMTTLASRSGRVTPCATSIHASQPVLNRLGSLSVSVVSACRIANFPTSSSGTRITSVSGIADVATISAQL